MMKTSIYLLIKKFVHDLTLIILSPWEILAPFWEFLMQGEIAWIRY